MPWSCVLHPWLPEEALTARARILSFPKNTRLPSSDRDGDVRIGAPESNCQAMPPPARFKAVRRPLVEATMARWREVSISGAVAIGPVRVFHNLPPEPASKA